MVSIVLSSFFGLPSQIPVEGFRFKGSEYLCTEVSSEPNPPKNTGDTHAQTDTQSLGLGLKDEGCIPQRIKRVV